MFMDALLTGVEHWKQPKCPFTGNQIKYNIFIKGNTTQHNKEWTTDNVQQYE